VSGLVQARHGTTYLGGTAALTAPPVPGNLVILQTTNDLPAGFTDLLGGTFVDFAAAQAGFHLGGRIAAAGESGVYSSLPCEYVIAEFAGFGTVALDPQSIARQAYAARAHVTTTPVYAGEVLYLGAFIRDSQAGYGLTPDAGFAEVERNDADANAWTLSLIYNIEPGGGAWDVGETNAVGYGNWGAAALGLQGAPGGDGGVEGDPPPYEPPAPANAILEIYVAEPGADRWDVALWDAASWAASAWIDITPWSIFADIAWGADRGEAGILADTAAGLWTVETYDPDRVLDPSNPDSPFAPELVPGLPIRLSHRGRIIRTGRVDRLWYSFEDQGGRITSSDAVADAQRAKVPEDTVLADTLRARARDAIAAAGLVLEVEADPPAGDPPLAPADVGSYSVWAVIAYSAREVLHVPWIDNHGTLRFRAWATGLSRGAVIAAPELIDLATWTSDEDLYSVVRVNDFTAAITQERRATPLPRYGERVHDRTLATINGGAWADAVLADRRDQSLRYRPGDIRPASADAVERLAQLEPLEDVTLALPAESPSVEVRARILGIRVRAVDETTELGFVRTRWRWNLITTVTAAAPLIGDGTDPPEFLHADQDPDQFLYPDGVTAL
jgi:hypothetical protein